MRRSLIVLSSLAVALAAMPSASAAAPYAPDPTWQANDTVRVIGYNPTTMYFGGEFTSMRPPFAAAGSGEVARGHVAAISLSTGNLTSWAPNVNGKVFALEVVGNVIYLGGSFTQVNGVARKNLAAVDASTGNVLSWNPSTNNTVHEIRMGPNGNLFIGGYFSSIGGVSRTRIAQLTTGGSVLAWAPDIEQITAGFSCPPRCNPFILSIDFSVNGSLVYFGGHFGLVNGVVRNQAAAVGINDANALQAFNPNIYADANCPLCTTNETSRVYEIMITSTKAYMCGGFWKVYGNRRAYNVMVTNLTNGAPDPVFAAGNDGDTTGCALSDGVLYMGGHFDYVGPICSPNPPPGKNATKCTPENGSTTRHHAAAVDATTGAILAWDPVANASTGIYTIQAGPGGVVGFGGHFTKMGKTTQQAIALYKTRLA